MKSTILRKEKDKSLERQNSQVINLALYCPGECIILDYSFIYI